MTIITKENSTADDDFSEKYSCDACDRDLTALLRIRCAECTDEFDLCVDCFSRGAELKDHKRTHAYTVHEALDFTLYDSEWNAREELLLVDGIKAFGLGNWEQVADHIGTKSKEEVATHYEIYFQNSEIWPLPAEGTAVDKSIRKPVVRDPNPPVRKPFRAPTSAPSNHDIGGFMPGRGEFEYEFDQDAEATVGAMVFDETDSPDEIALKTTVLNIYNTTLDRRIERKKFVKDRELTTDFRKILANEKKKTKEEKDTLHRVRVYSRLLTSRDFDVFVTGIQHEQELRRKIAQLQEYRRMGVTCMAQAQEYEKDKQNRNLLKISLSTSLGHPTGTRQTVRSKLDDTSPPRPPGIPSRITYNPNARRPTQPLDVTSADGVDLLLPNERELCSTLRILPRAYLVIKETLLRAHAAQGELKRRDARGLVRIDVNKTAAIFDLLEVNGWLKAE